MTNSQQSGFEFVIQDPNERFSKDTQTKIRKQAMRAVGAARRKSGRFSSSSPTIRRDSDQIRLFHPMPISGLELLVRDRGIDPLDLSALTSVHIGVIASKILSLEPNRLPGVLICRQRSYFSFIPTRLGYTLVLDDAFRCLITAAHSILVQDHKSRHETILSYYAKALHSLQSAVNDPEAWCSAEVLCATAILALFELLNPSNGQSWSQHIAGASRLTQLRGPSSFISEFDKSLFISLSYPVCAENLLQNESSFLDDPAWTEVYIASIVHSETFTDRSSLGIHLLMIMAKVAGLAKRTNHAVVIQETLQMGDFEVIATDIRAVRSSIIAWRRKFNTTLLHARRRCQDDYEDFGKRYELLGISLIINIILSRLLCAIVPNDRGLLEEEVQNLVAELKDVEGSASHNRRAEFFFAQKAKVAEAAIATYESFQDVLDSGKVVEPWRLNLFFKVMGRKCCTGGNCCDS